MAALDASQPVKLGFVDDGDTGTVDSAAAAQAVTTALDTFLDGAQAGTPDLDALGASWLLATDTEDAVTALATLQAGLATRENPVTSATYDLSVQVEATATLVAATVGVTRADGSVVTVQLAFDVTTTPVTLVAVGPGGGA